MAWELLTDVYGLDPDRIYATYFGGQGDLPADDEAKEIWLKYLKPHQIIPFDMVRSALTFASRTSSNCYLRRLALRWHYELLNMRCNCASGGQLLGDGGSGPMWPVH